MSYGMRLVACGFIAYIIPRFKIVRFVDLEAEKKIYASLIFMGTDSPAYQHQRP
jgi:hypothetical protein